MLLCTGIVSLLLEYRIHLIDFENGAYQTMIQVSTGELRFEGLKEWLGNNGKKMG